MPSVPCKESRQSKIGTWILQTFNLSKDVCRFWWEIDTILQHPACTNIYVIYVCMHVNMYVCKDLAEYMDETKTYRTRHTGLDCTCLIYRVDVLWCLILLSQYIELSWVERWKGLLNILWTTIYRSLKVDLLIEQKPTILSLSQALYIHIYGGLQLRCNCLFIF